MEESDKKETDWSFAESVQKKATYKTGIRPKVGDLINTIENQASLKPKVITVKGETPEGILAKYRQKQLSRKASIDALQAQYNSQLDVLKHQLSRAGQVEKSRADVIAEEYLKELDAQHLQVLSELGLRNKETRERALLKLTDATTERLREVSNRDWPQFLIDQTIDELIELRRRAVAEIMNELGNDSKPDGEKDEDGKRS